MYERIIKIVTDIIGVFLKSISGFWGFIISFIYKIIQEKAVKAGENLDNHIEHKQEAEEKLGPYNDVVKNPESTNEQIIKAEDDFFNRP